MRTGVENLSACPHPDVHGGGVPVPLLSAGVHRGGKILLRTLQHLRSTGPHNAAVHQLQPPMHPSVCRRPPATPTHAHLPRRHISLYHTLGPQPLPPTRSGSKPSIPLHHIETQAQGWACCPSALCWCAQGWGIRPSSFLVCIGRGIPGSCLMTHPPTPPATGEVGCGHIREWGVRCPGLGIELAKRSVILRCH